MRLHHRLVFIHPFPNGNGRWARLASDIYLVKHSEKKIHWSVDTGVIAADFRDAYITALKNADQGNFEPLLGFFKEHQET